jgi:two-component system sensor kinase FixL
MTSGRCFNNCWLGISSWWMDKVQIQQVLLNLMRNAIEAMEGAPDRGLTVLRHRRTATWAAISVADPGHGLAPEVSAQLFQPFVSTKRRNGSGLSLSRTIVEAHGGQIAAEPNSGGGTVFRFTLRAVTKEEMGDVS